MMLALGFAISITLPNLLLMALGYFMQRTGAIHADFVNLASNIVFNYCLPCLLFFSVIKSQVDYGQQMWLILAGVVVTFILYIGAEVYARCRIAAIEDQGVFVQGVFRSNMAIISLATVTNAYGDAGLSVGAVYMGVITILFNILAVITLSRTQQGQTSGWKKATEIGKKMLKNPLIIALVSAFAYKAMNLPLPPVPIVKTGELLAGVALPLALICAGASLDLRSMFALSGVSMQASIGRVLIAPLVAVAVGLYFNLAPLHMGVLFIMVSAPVAAASYVMTKAMGGNATLAANILAFTTVVSMLSMGAGAAILRSLGLM
ncbi:MAG: AEC family transporter [Acinetobacter sp.]|nr:AEC family transporter [Acinetobacter sp.]